MNENRKRILEMLAAGQINTEEAERLMGALEQQAAAPPPAEPSGGRPGGLPKYLRVVVEAQEGHHGRGPAKVNVRVPMQLLRAGVRLASLIPPQARGRVNEAMHAKGLVLDLNQIKPENLEAIIDQLKDLTVDVDEEKAKVRIFCE